MVNMSLIEPAATRPATLAAATGYLHFPDHVRLLSDAADEAFALTPCTVLQVLSLLPASRWCAPEAPGLQRHLLRSVTGFSVVVRVHVLAGEDLRSRLEAARVLVLAQLPDGWRVTAAIYEQFALLQWAERSGTEPLDV